MLLVIPDVLAGDVDVVSSDSQVASRNGSGAPLGLGGKACLLVLTSGRHNHVLAVNVLCFGSHGRELLSLFLLLLNLSSLLSLHRWSADLHSENDISDLGIGERRRVDVVLLSVVVQDQITQLHFNLNPVVIGERGPDVVLLRDDGLVGAQEQLGLVLVDVQSSQDQDQTRECGVR